MNQGNQGGGGQGQSKHPADKAMTQDTTRDPSGPKKKEHADQGMAHDTTRDPDQKRAHEADRGKTTDTGADPGAPHKGPGSAGGQPNQDPTGTRRGAERQ